MAIRPNTSVTALTPPSVGIQKKIVQVVRTDTARFDAFVLPKGAVISGVFIAGATASDAATTATITVGVGAGGAELLNAYSVKTNVGFGVPASTAGSYVGTQLAADTLFKAVYAESGTASTTGGPWLVEVEYYLPQSGFSF